MTTIRESFLVAADSAVGLLHDPAVAARWDEPSALPEMTVRSLAGHLAQQVFRLEELLVSDDSTGELGTLAGHYSAAQWISAIDTPANVGVRERGEVLAADGPVVLADRAAATVTALHDSVTAASADRTLLVPWTGWRLTLDDFLLTRTLELTIHADDLAVSVDIPTPALPVEVYAPVIHLLTDIAVDRHGPLALQRALSRRERAPETIAGI